MPMGQSTSTQPYSTVPVTSEGNCSNGSENTRNGAFSYNVYQPQPHTVAASGLTSEKDKIFQSVLRYYFHENSLADLRSADRISRNEEGVDNYRPGGYHKVRSVKNQLIDYDWTTNDLNFSINEIRLIAANSIINDI